MEWFKHRTQSHEDPDISDAMDEFGDAGYTVFFIILEVYGCEFSHIDKNGFIHLTLKFFERKLRRKWKKIEKILSFYQSRQRILFEKTEQGISIKVPKYLKDSSNWTKRQKGSPTEVPTEAPTEAPTAIEAEADKEADKEKSKKQRRPFALREYIEEPYSPPEDDLIKEGSTDLVESLIEDTKIELFRSGIFPDVMKFMKYAEDKNRKATLHTLVQCYKQKPDNPGGFCRRVLDIENGNFNALEYEAAHGGDP